jgi:hypothetical protein
MSALPDKCSCNEPNDAALLKRMTEGKAMPIFRSIESKLAPLLCAVLVCTLGPGVACATLGEAETTVQTDVAQLRASLRSSEDRTGYRVHEIQLPTGTVLREFVAPGGNVFAVAWTGPAKPDLRQTLGKYFDTLVSAPKAKAADRRHLQIQQGDLIVEGRGHMRALSGRAYLASAIPSGVNLGELH